MFTYVWFVCARLTLLKKLLELSIESKINKSKSLNDTPQQQSAKIINKQSYIIDCDWHFTERRMHQRFDCCHKLLSCHGAETSCHCRSNITNSTVARRSDTSAHWAGQSCTHAIGTDCRLRGNGAARRSDPHHT